MTGFAARSGQCSAPVLLRRSRTCPAAMPRWVTKESLRRVAIPPGGNRHCHWKTTRIGCGQRDPDRVAIHPTLEARRNQEAISVLQMTQDLKDQIKEKIVDAMISGSSFDTAWVAMVPSLTSPLHPCFPECLEWILKSQNSNGSWTSNENKFLIKDALSSTLACIIALRKWNVGEDQVRKGIDFIQCMSSFAIDERQYSPIGFNIIFTGMLNYSKDFGLQISIDEVIFKKLLLARHMELQRADSTCWKTYLAFIPEGIDHIPDWHELKKYQHENGSLFNSPSATATMLLHVWSDKALKYLQSVVNRFRDAVPPIYPSETYTHLRVVDFLNELGIAGHFSDYIRRVIEKTYRAWLQNDAEIISEVSTCALAFRLLRVNEYDISSDQFCHLIEDKLPIYKSNTHPQNIATVLELYKASQIQISKNELRLKDLNSWSSEILKQSMSNYLMHNDLEDAIMREVDYNLEFSFAEKMYREEHKRKIETSIFNTIQCLKTAFMFDNVDVEDVLTLAVEDFNAWQCACQKELQQFHRWVGEKRLHELVKFDVNVVNYSYYTAAAGFCHPNLTEARLGWAKNCLLTTLVDDIFDVSGSVEERANLVDLFKRWDPNYKTRCCSEQVYIIFDTVYSTIEEIGAKASSIHGFSATSHLVELWVELVIAMNLEADWRSNGIVPTIEQYVEAGYVSFALGPIIASATYFVGPILSWDIVRSEEYGTLFKLVSIAGRLINDIRGFERESKENKLNSVSLHIVHGCGLVSEEHAKRKVWNIIKETNIEILRLVLRQKGSVVPRECKQVFWIMCKSANAFYRRTDGFRTSNMVPSMRALLHEPINCPRRNSLHK